MFTASISLAVACLAFGTGMFTGRVTQRPPRPQAPPALPEPSGPCTCSHEKSFHNGGKGVCRELDSTKTYVNPVMHGASPACRCAMYVPKNPPVPVAPVPADLTPADLARLKGYDPDYVRFMEHVQNKGANQ